MVSIPSRFQGIEIPADNPFKNDKLGYSKYESVFKGMVDMYKDTGCVIALNGKWGSGKTTYIKMWQASLQNQGYNTIYFNAWETDYLQDPLIAILGELKGISKDNSKFQSVFSRLGSIAVSGGWAIIKGLLKKSTGVEADAVSEAIDQTKRILLNDLEEYAKQKSSLEEFKKALEEYVADQYENPVVFIVDELDRCNPHYAVRTLEIMKHLFDVPNICFVLTIDKSQLECSIKGFYGSGEIDANNYLRRFIDIEYRMPEPSLDGFTELLYEHYGFQAFFDTISEDHFHTPDDFRDMSTALCKLFRLDLRTYDKIMAHTRLVFIQQKMESILVDVVLLLNFLRIALPDFFDAISRHDFSVNGLLEEFEKRFPQDLLVENDGNYSRGRLAHKMIYLIGPFLRLYNVQEGSELEPGYSGSGMNETFPLTCHIIDQEALFGALRWFNRRTNLNYGLDNVIKTVNLFREFS